MSDAKQRPDAAPNPHPQNQTDENKGNIKGPQVTDHNIETTDLPAGAEGSTRRASHGNR